MNRSVVITTGVLLLAVSGCSSTQERVPGPGCQVADFDVSACDRSGFASVQGEGIWHATVTLDGLASPGAFRLSPEPGSLFGTALSERQVGADTFFLASDYLNGSVPSRLVLSGCQATSPERLKGEFRRCADNEADLQGSFEAVRVRRMAGEQEQSGVELVSQTALPRGTAVDVFVSGGFAYVTALADGLFIYDVSKPDAPTKVAEITPTNDVWYRAWVKGQTLYVSSNRQGLLVYDVSTPSAPKRLSALPQPAIQGWGLYVDQDRLYVMSPAPAGEVLIYDVQKPAQPSLLARYYVEESVVNLGEIPVEGVALGNRLYLGHWRYGLAVADVTEPTKPATLGHFGYDQSTSRPVAAGAIGERTIAFEASEGWGSRVRALDVTDPQNITQVGQFQTRPESTVSGLTLVGSKLYVAYTLDGLRILDMANPSTPRQLAYYNTWRESDSGRGQTFSDGLSAVKVPGDGYIYAAETSRGLLVLREQ